VLEEKFAMAAGDIVRAFNQLRLNDNELIEQQEWIENMEKYRDYQAKQLTDSAEKVNINGALIHAEHFRLN